MSEETTIARPDVAAVTSLHELFRLLIGQTIPGSRDIDYPDHIVFREIIRFMTGKQNEAGITRTNGLREKAVELNSAQRRPMVDWFLLRTCDDAQPCEDWPMGQEWLEEVDEQTANDRIINCTMHAAAKQEGISMGYIKRLLEESPV
jgi:hypothetical protein